MQFIVTPVGPAGVQVYNPASVGKPHAVVHNPGPAILYLGQQGVTAQNGFPLRPKETIELPWGLDALYAICGGLTLSGTVTTTTTAALTHGASTVAAVTASAAFTVGQIVQVGAGTSAETLTVAAKASASITFTSKPVLDHVSGVAVTAVTAGSAGSIKVTTGTT